MDFIIGFTNRHIQKNQYYFGVHGSICFFVQYLIKSILTDKQIIEMEDAEAVDIIRSVSPDFEGKPEYDMEPIQSVFERL